MSDESPEGFAKRGTDLEGRVAQLLRLMGFNVSRNEIIEGHEIDVYGEKDGKKIIVECKEYYNELIKRDLILIFTTKVRDINPDESWFVTIYDFESPALELCKRYGIRAVNGYDLEELEDRAINNKGNVELGRIPEEDRYLRLLNRRHTELSREKRRYEDIRRVTEHINSLRIKQIELPPFLFPTMDIEEKYLWLKDLEKMPKITQEGSVDDIIINIGGPPQVRGFKISKENKLQLAPIILIILWVINVLLFYSQHPWISSLWANYDMFYVVLFFQYIIIPLILSLIIIFYRNRLVLKSIQIINRSILDIEIRDNVMHFIRASTFNDESGDHPSKKLYDLNVFLVDKRYLGKSNDYIIEKGSWLIRGLQVQLAPDISKETNVDQTIIPTKDLELSIIGPQPEIKVNALYVLGDLFFKERKMV
jgi:hypothetical protein